MIKVSYERYIAFCKALSLSQIMSVKTKQVWDKKGNTTRSLWLGRKMIVTIINEKEYWLKMENEVNYD